MLIVSHEVRDCCDAVVRCPPLHSSGNDDSESGSRTLAAALGTKIDQSLLLQVIFSLVYVNNFWTS